MAYVIIALVGFVGGAICVFVALHTKLQSQKRYQQSRLEQIETAQQVLTERTREHAKEDEDRQSALAVRERYLEEHNENRDRALAARARDLDDATTRFKAAETEFNARAVSYKELQDENEIVKQDMRNLDVQMRKLELDRDVTRQSQDALDERVQELGSRYLKENVKWIGTSLNQNNYVNS